jgi:RHS repeat-associated protein
VFSDPVTGQASLLTTSTDVVSMYLWDGLGNPVGLLTDGASNPVPATYDPYGLRALTAANTDTGVAQNPYAFKAGIYDRGTGLVKFGLRWYDVVTGAWTQQDTLDAPLDPGNANRYGFAGGDPVNNSDPSGLFSGSQVVGAGAGIAAGVAVGTVICGVTAGVGCGAGALLAGFTASAVGSAVGSATTASLDGGNTRDAFFDGLGIGSIGGLAGPAGRLAPALRF